MKPVPETIASLGTPVFMHTVGEGPYLSAVIARWRHGNAEVDIGASDIVRVAISLQDGQHVRHQMGNAASRVDITVGSVSVLPAQERIKVMIQGEANILQIFLRETFLGSKLIHSQKASAVARATPERKLAASLS